MNGRTCENAVVLDGSGPAAALRGKCRPDSRGPQFQLPGQFAGGPGAPANLHRISGGWMKGMRISRSGALRILLLPPSNAACRIAAGAECKTYSDRAALADPMQVLQDSAETVLGAGRGRVACVLMGRASAAAGDCSPSSHRRLISGGAPADTAHFAGQMCIVSRYTETLPGRVKNCYPGSKCGLYRDIKQ